MTTSDMLKLLPAALVVSAFIATNAVAQWRIEQLEKQIENQSYTDPRVTELMQQQAASDARFEAQLQSIKEMQERLLDNLLNQ